MRVSGARGDVTQAGFGELRGSGGQLGSPALVNPQGPIGQFRAGVAMRRGPASAFLWMKCAQARLLILFFRETLALSSEAS